MKNNRNTYLPLFTASTEAAFSVTFTTATTTTP
jgi:hypothetical protein